MNEVLRKINQVRNQKRWQVLQVQINSIIHSFIEIKKRKHCAIAFFSLMSSTLLQRDREEVEGGV